MGHDYITNGHRQIRLSNWDIWTLRHFLCEIASDATPSDLGMDETTLSLVRRYFESWDWIAPDVVTGTELGDFIQQKQEREKLLALLFRRTIDKIESFGEVIPLKYLQEHVDTPTAFFLSPQPTERFVKALLGLVELVT